MIKQLRKRHFQLWAVLLIALPAGIISAMQVIPRWPVNSLLQPAKDPALPEIVKTIERENYTIRIRKGSDAWQLEWVNKNVLAVPTALIYKTTADNRDINKAEFIGRIEARGIYHFGLAPGSFTVSGNSRLLLYDFIHHQIIDTINF